MGVSPPRDRLGDGRHREEDEEWTLLGVGLGGGGEEESSGRLKSRQISEVPTRRKFGAPRSASGSRGIGWRGRKKGT